MKTFKGKVVSLDREKTATVLVSRQWKHPLYKKYVTRSKKYACAYDPKLELEKHDQVIIEECRPLSKTKHFKIVSKLDKQQD